MLNTSLIVLTIKTVMKSCTVRNEHVRTGILRVLESIRLFLPLNN